MIVRKYTDGDSNLEVSINEENTHLCFEIETDGVCTSVNLDYKDSYDLKDRLYDLLKKIEPKKEKANG